MKASEIQTELNRLKGSLSHTEKRAIFKTVNASGAVIGQFYLDGEPAEGEPLFTMLHSFFEFFRSEKRFLCAYSGRASGKSWAFAQWLLAQSYEHQKRNLFLREKQNSLQESSYYLLKSMIMDDPRLLDHFDVLSNKIVGVNGSEFVFKGLQSFTASSIKSFEGFDYAYVDEAQALSNRSASLLLPTIRKPNSKLLFGLNPENSDDYIFTEFIETERKDTEKRKFNYLDNPFNSEETIALAEHDRLNRSDLYQHIWQGEILVRSELRIFTNWKIWDFDFKAVRDREKQFVDTFKESTHGLGKKILTLAGIDYGFTDETFMSLAYASPDHKRLYVVAEYCKTNKTISALCEELMEFDELASYAAIVADNSRPEAIAAMKKYGFNIRGCKKYGGSVLDGISRLQNMEIFIHSRCKNLITAMSLYSWKTNKQTDEILNVPDHAYSHGPDSLRYLSENLSVLQRREYKPMNNFKMG